MRYNVAQLLKQGVGAARRYEIVGQFEDIDELNPGARELLGEVTLIRTPTGILARGSAEINLTRECRRCMATTSSDVMIEFEEEFLPTIDIETGATLPITDEDEPELLIDGHHTLDLTEVLRQYAVATGTTYALCREGCKGLCPSCGQDLNEGSCECKRSEPDPRLEVLASLLGSMGDDSLDEQE